MSSPKTTLEELRTNDLRLAIVMRRLGYGRFENVPIKRGRLVLDPWPTTIRTVKFGNATPNQPQSIAAGTELKKQIVELFAQISCIDSGLIRTLEFRGGLPFSVEIVVEPLCE